jgi:hypothetical protein
MPYTKINRAEVKFKPLKYRKNRVFIERDYIDVHHSVNASSEIFEKITDEAVHRIKLAKWNKKPVMLATGAHTIKNGLGPVLIKLMEQKWITHLATNGAGIIHDWEFAYQGESSEDVKANVDKGEFGIWEETNKFINIALIAGAYEGMGYGESVGAMIENNGVNIPSKSDLSNIIHGYESTGVEQAAAALDFMKAIDEFELKPGWLQVQFPYKKYCVQSNAYKLNIPFTGHPMFGHDIIYTHPISAGSAIGRTAERDFLTFADSVNRLDGGVYLSIGSAVMSPMIFEKSLSMAQNIHIQKQRHMDNHYMLIIDLAKSSWDWQANGEPPETDPAYYLRYLKTFSRMGGTMKYLSADNRDFLLAIYQKLQEEV